MYQLIITNLTGIHTLYNITSKENNKLFRSGISVQRALDNMSDIPLSEYQEELVNASPICISFSTPKEAKENYPELFI